MSVYVVVANIMHHGSDVHEVWVQYLEPQVEG